jgi:8-hydroxy-5-deazaflavin:NADPH oxidoreductase
MRIGIVGAGELGTTLAELWAKAGHEVVVGDPRGPAPSVDAVERIDAPGGVVTADEAARLGELVVLAVPFELDALPAASSVAGKVVIDAMNAVTEDGAEMDLGGRTSSELVAERLPDARIVKAFNTIEASVLRQDQRLSVPSERRFAVFLAGDHGLAKERVKRLIEEIGFTPIDTGSLAWGGHLQAPGSDVFNHPMLPDEAQRVLWLMG